MISFRQLTEVSADIVEVHGQSFTHGWSVSAFQELLNKPTTRLYAAYEAENLVALVLAAVVLPECEILTVATAPSARRKGIGRGLLQHMLGKVRQAGAEDIHLEVATDNEAAIGLYHSLGFQKAGLRKAYYDRRPAPPVDALVLKLNIPAL
jgi:[ribosomal protein S18]-alanine N-acetyltransferase